MKTRIAFLAATVALAANAGQVQVFPAGPFVAIDGRPGNGLSWIGDAAAAQRVIDQFNARKNPLVIDYEHQTFLAKDNGQPAPAAGWIDSLEWRDGVGLFAAVRWTDRAKAMIESGEYKYFSPGLEYDKATGAIQALHPSALTNHPGIDGMQELLSAITHFNSEHEEISMKTLLAAVLTALNMRADVAEADAVTAFAALKAKADGADAQATEIATLKAAQSTAKPDPAKYVEVTAFEQVKTELATLKAADTARTVEELIKPALEDGRLIPAQEKWARELGASNVAQLKTYLDSAAPIAALKSSQTLGKPPVDANGKTVLTETQIALCKQIGVSEEAYAKQLASEKS